MGTRSIGSKATSQSNVRDKEKQSRVGRPTKRSEFAIVFATNSAQKGWRDIDATSRNALAEAWDFLTRTPLHETPTNYRLRGSLGQVVRNGKVHDRWQLKLTRQGDARIWFYVEAGVVHLEQVHTNHPNETK